jgi:hypothetical protein
LSSKFAANTELHFAKAHTEAYMRLIAILFFATTACGGAAAKVDLASQEADLTGVWTATFRSGSAATSGVIALFQSARLSDSFGFRLVAGATQGTYDLNFEPLGFKLAGGAALQPASSAIKGDSVEIVLNPYVGHGKVVMKGARSRGSITGIWSYDGRGGGTGSFELTRMP